KVTYLKRTAMGPLKLDEQLPMGSYRELTSEELSWIGRDIASATSEV
ncbi:16S rRNA pseudouridine(516) synthase, partial [Paenibacillus sp. EKM208P]